MHYRKTMISYLADLMALTYVMAMSARPAATASLVAVAHSAYSSKTIASR